jgi:subtilisin-like proprotein convertase family protein
MATSDAVPTVINHECIQDLSITLVSPLGTSALLAESSNDTCSDDLKGSFPYFLTPVDDLEDFFNQTINGTWRISITDSFEADNGTFTSWGLKFLL